MFKNCSFGKRWVYRDDRAQLLAVMHGILLRNDEPYVFEIDNETSVVDFGHNLATTSFDTKGGLVVAVSKHLHKTIRDHEENIAICHRKLQLLINR